MRHPRIGIGAMVEQRLDDGDLAAVCSGMEQRAAATVVEARVRRTAVRQVVVHSRQVTIMGLLGQCRGATDRDDQEYDRKRDGRRACHRDGPLQDSHTAASDARCLQIRVEMIERKDREEKKPHDSGLEERAAEGR